MTASLWGCEIGDRVHSNARSTVYRGRRRADGHPVVLKVLNEKSPTPAQLSALRHEHALLCQIDDPGVIGTLGIEADGEQWALLLEDFGGVSLREQGIAGRMPLAELLELAIGITDALGAIHKRRIVHRDVNPSNVVSNPRDKRIKIIDFDIATALVEESTGFVNPSRLEGTLAYMSPEQTGRMNRPVDYRTDYYSLGVTLFELFTGRTPFVNDDALGMVHMHIARTPPSPRELDPAIPQPVAAIVLKLLAKNADDRYQSARGLRADLVTCLEQLGANGRIEDFPLGQHDASDRFRLPRRLYGREREVEQLLSAFERVAGGATLMLVSGHAGIGKSSLVHELYRPLTAHRGYFVAGKFDQYQNNVPYSAVLQAFEALFAQVLTESDDRLAAFRDRIRAALQGNLGALVAVCPSLRLIVGADHDLGALPLGDARTRFHAAVRQLLSVFATPEHPLCLVFDDLQWADVDTLKLLDELMRSGADLPLLLLGAYRDNEVGPSHPLMSTLKEIEESGARVERLPLAPLAPEDVRALVADTLSISLEAAAALAELVHACTGGNPFFARAFLASLHDGGLLRFEGDGWRWDLDGIRRHGVTENVVDLMIDRVRRLPAATQEVLQFAACIGRSFDIETLGVVAERADGSPGRDLWAAVADGLVIPTDRIHSALELGAAGAEVTLRFAHDRIQQAVVSMVDPERRAILHRDVGRRLLRSVEPEERERRLFDIVGQLDQGVSAITDPRELDELAHLNLEAARAALRAAAAQQALSYVQAALPLLSEADWNDRYPLTYELHLKGAEAAFHCARFETFDELSKTVLARARTVHEEVPIRKLESQVLFAKQQFGDATDLFIGFVRRLGVDLIAAPTQEDVGREIQATMAAIGDRSIEGLAHLPDCQDPAVRGAMEILLQLAFHTVSQSFQLHAVVVCRMIQLSIRHGNAPESSVGYLFFGVMLAYQGVFDSAYRYGRTALSLVERCDDKGLRSQVYLYANYFLIHWQVPHRDLSPAFLDAYRYGMEAGSPFNASCGATTLSINRFLAGLELGEAEREFVRYSEVVVKLRQPIVLNWHQVFQQTIANLRGAEAMSAIPLAGPFYDEEQRLSAHLAANDTGQLYNYYYCKTLLAYLFGDHIAGAAHADGLSRYHFFGGTTIYSTGALYLASLARLAACDFAEPAERQRLLGLVDGDVELLRKRLEHCPTTVAHKLRLVEAERARVLGAFVEARPGFELAVELARKSGYPHEEAITLEVAGRFYLSGNDPKRGRALLREAHSAYLRWGAIAKVRRLEKTYPYLLPRVTTGALGAATLAMTSSQSWDFNVLDLISALDASQALSREVELDRLLMRLMELLLETSGAEAGYLLFEREGQWVVEAQKTSAEAAAEVLQSVPLATLAEAGRGGLPISVVNYVARTQEELVLDDASADPRFRGDPWIADKQVRSVLCLPLGRQASRASILYLQNNLIQGAFTRGRIQILQFLSTQAVISLENAVLYQTLEQKVRDRTRELTDRNAELAAALDRLREAQNRMIVQDRLASLGALTTGIAHEIRNPLSFVLNFADICQGLLEEASAHAGQLVEAPRTTDAAALDEVLGDIGTNLAKIAEHGQRISGVVKSMIDHSQGGKGELQDVDFNAFLQSYVTIGQHSLQARHAVLARLEIVTDLDPSAGTVTLVPSEVSRVVVNLLENAGYAVSAKKGAHGDAYTPSITVATHDRGDAVEVRVRDNGGGIPAALHERVFTPFFTTKPTGQGTGLGLSISHDIIVKGHAGELRFETAEGRFTEFIVSLPRRRTRDR